MRLPKLPAEIQRGLTWQFADRALRIVAGIITSIYVARSYAPGGFGLINYFQSVSAAFLIVSNLGLEQVLTMNYLQENDSTYFSSAIPIRLLLNTLLFVGATLLFAETPYLLPISGYFPLLFAFLIFGSFESVRTYFEASEQTPSYIKASLACLLFFSTLRILFAKHQYHIDLFILLLPLESAATLALLICYTKDTRQIIRRALTTMPTWTDTQKKLLRDSIPFYLSSLAIFIYMKIDTLMIGGMTNVSEVGLYSLACKLTEGWYFIPTIFSTIFLPRFAKKLSPISLRDQGYRSYFAVTNTVCLIVVFLSIGLMPTIITTLTTSAFSGASEIAKMHIWTLLFVNIGVQSNIYLMITNQKKYILVRTAAGALINVLFNFALIPRYGAWGASLATLIAQVSSSIAIDLFFKSQWNFFVFKIQSIFDFRSIAKAIHE